MMVAVAASSKDETQRLQSVSNSQVRVTISSQKPIGKQCLERHKKHGKYHFCRHHWHHLPSRSQFLMSLKCHAKELKGKWGTPNFDIILVEINEEMTELLDWQVWCTNSRRKVNLRKPMQVLNWICVCSKNQLPIKSFFLEGTSLDKLSDQKPVKMEVQIILYNKHRY